MWRYFYPRSPCGERQTTSLTAVLTLSFLSTLSLRRATKQEVQKLLQSGNFYPRSPCGERLRWPIYAGSHFDISIHALLAESDQAFQLFFAVTFEFLSTLSLRRATVECFQLLVCDWLFLSTLSLRRATILLGKTVIRILDNFYPRSPCGERPSQKSEIFGMLSISIHALLAESDGSVPSASGGAASISIHALLAESDFGLQNRKKRHNNFYPRSPCGERLGAGCTKQTARSFLSTLSLRRATAPFPSMVVIFGDFYPRSPCGERPPCPRCSRGTLPISIHALLAESDLHTCCICVAFDVFLSTLSLRRATQKTTKSASSLPSFLSTLSLRRATTFHK